MLIYVHGFNSSALSYKARIIRERMNALGCGDAFRCPELSHRPAEAVRELGRLVAAQTAGRVALIGSSLGGYYATWLAERHAVRAVLVNPAVRPYELLQNAIGPQTNLYTGAKYIFKPAHLEELRALEVPQITPVRYLLIVRTGDEVLDYRQAVDRYHGCEQIVVPGGDHGFGDFDRYLDRTLAFCGIAAGAAAQE